MKASHSIEQRLVKLKYSEHCEAVSHFYHLDILRNLLFLFYYFSLFSFSKLLTIGTVFFFFFQIKAMCSSVLLRVHFKCLCFYWFYFRVCSTLVPISFQKSSGHIFCRLKVYNHTVKKALHL